MSWRGKDWIDYSEEDAIGKLLIGRQIVSVDGETMTLDDGKKITVHPNEGCGGCSSGWYSLSELNECEAVITSVRCDVAGDQPGDFPTVYRIYVLAAGKENVAMAVSGDDGNGYYGTGYQLEVTLGEV